MDSSARSRVETLQAVVRRGLKTKPKPPSTLDGRRVPSRWLLRRDGQTGTQPGIVPGCHLGLRPTRFPRHSGTPGTPGDSKARPGPRVLERFPSFRDPNGGISEPNCGFSPRSRDFCAFFSRFSGFRGRLCVEGFRSTFGRLWAQKIPQGAPGNPIGWAPTFGIIKAEDKVRRGLTFFSRLRGQRGP